jgi:hypothetical protein
MLWKLLVVICLAAPGGYLLNEHRSFSAPAKYQRTKTTSKPFAATAVKSAMSNDVSSFNEGRRKLSASPAAADYGRRSAAEVPEFKLRQDGSGTVSTASVLGAQMPGPLLSFDGLKNADNVDAFGLIIAPPDMVGEAGPDHYVQVANALFRVFSKTGQPLTAPIPLNFLFRNLGTPCSNRNDGLPNLIYDQLADRWLISQVCSIYPPFRQMIAVSKTGDPLGQWFAYEFVMPNVKLNDFPKMSMWPEGYYKTTNEFLGSDYTGHGVFAFDRGKILEGDPKASYVYFSVPGHTTFPVGILPADLDGLRPPPDGTPAIIATHSAVEYSEPVDAIRLYDFHPDFAEPSRSLLVERAESPIKVAAFDPTSAEGRADIAQPVPGAPLDSVSDTLMPRLAYRNFETHQSLVVNQTVRTTPPNETYRAGVRIYELRNSAGKYAPIVDSTIGDAVSSRWIGSAAQDHLGNLAVQYNLVSDAKPVSITYSGRLADDTTGSFRHERALIEGTGVQRGFGWRWGEYSSISVDPVDDCTFWITNAYYTLESQQFSDWGWLTRIGNFRFDECAPAPAGFISGIITNRANGQPVAGARISINAYTRNTPENGKYGPMRVPAGDHEVRVFHSAFREEFRQVSIEAGVPLFEPFTMEPIAVVSAISKSIVSESCALDKTIDPGETVTIDIAFQNTGAAGIASLKARLMEGGGVVSPGPIQEFGPVPAGSASVVRSFTFTADAGLKCGSDLHLTFALFDGAAQIGEHSIRMPTGRSRIALAENFDRISLGALPRRWTRQAFALDGSTDAMRNWRLSTSRVSSGTKSLFSPSPDQAGWNEIASPVFKINTGSARLTFRNWYELETTFLRNRIFDGSVLEIKIGENDWSDIIAAGGSFVSGGYDGPIDVCCQNPLAGRPAWSGWSGINRPAEFITTAVRLPSSAAGQYVQLRWRIGTDIGTRREGQYIDDVVVTDGTACRCT